MTQVVYREDVLQQHLYKRKYFDYWKGGKKWISF